ncbi:MAG: hypothetical protein ACREV0_09605 [Burkholderiales bacterium]
MSGGGFGDAWIKIQQAFEQLWDTLLDNPIILIAAAALAFFLYLRGGAR